jgi:hypothetical protein
MKLECVQFWSTKGDDVRAQESLPAQLRQELIEGAWGIQVEASKTQVIEELEKRLKIGKSDDFVKYTHVEVDKSEIPNYSHFFIRPQEFGWKEEVFFEVTPQTCTAHNMCHWGVKIASPIQLRSSSLQGIGGIGGRPMLHTKLLFVTSEVRDLFESEGISGLEYESFEDLDGAAEPGFVAEVTHAAHHIGTKIIAKACPVHHSMFGCFVFDFQTPNDGLRNDFQMIDRVTVKGIDYAYVYPFLIVSQKVLNLLFAHSVAELESITTMLDEQFRPLIVS